MSSIIFPIIFNLTSTRRSTVSSTEDHARHSCFRSYRLLEKTWIKVLQTDVVFMDISKAFDTVDHSILLQKLQHFGFSGSLLLWFSNYLSGRFQRVIVHGSTSASLPITSGVPQGSLLGPFLFSIYINNLPNYVSPSTGVGLFADDTKLYRCIEAPCDALVLQEDIQGLQIWSNENRLCFNQSKCKVLSITRNKSHLINSIYPW